MMNTVCATWMMFFYTMPNHAGKILVGMGIMGAITAGGKVIDALYDPTIGYWSDNTMTRWGRRRPFIVGGAPLFFISFILIFHPFFAAGSTELILSVIALNTVFWLAFTTVMGPYNALLPEVALSSQKRVFLSTLLAAMMLLATGYQGMIFPLMFDKWGMGYFKAAATTGIIAFCLIMITVLVIKERIPSAGEKLAKSHEKHSFKEAFKWTFANKPFRIYIIASVFQYLGFSSIMAALPYIVKVLMNKPESFVSVVFAFVIPVFAISFVAVNFIAKKTGKVKLYKGCLLLLALLLPLLFFVGDPRIPISPVVAGIMLMNLLGFPLAGNMILPTAILADIIDYDEKITGRRREAIYFGM
ncbi:MAG TPA: MFS transporter, partial [bacterium]|nr:MFS transporter [bacterium]